MAQYLLQLFFCNYSDSFDVSPTIFAGQTLTQKKCKHIHLWPDPHRKQLLNPSSTEGVTNGPEILSHRITDFLLRYITALLQRLFNTSSEFSSLQQLPSNKPSDNFASCSVGRLGNCRLKPCDRLISNLKHYPSQLSLLPALSKVKK